MQVSRIYWKLKEKVKVEISSIPWSGRGEGFTVIRRFSKRENSDFFSFSFCCSQRLGKVQEDLRKILGVFEVGILAAWVVPTGTKECRERERYERKLRERRAETL